MYTYYDTMVVASNAAYDGNGNILTLINSSDGSTVAEYEYSPFGECIKATGPMAQANPFRFSTKYSDDETGLIYYGYRYYDAKNGRWVSRDLIEEEGGLMLYGFVGNNGVNIVDPYGMFPVSPGFGTKQVPDMLALDISPFAGLFLEWIFEIGEGDTKVMGANDPRTREVMKLQGVVEARAKFWRDNPNARKCEEFQPITHSYHFGYGRWQEDDFRTFTLHFLGTYDLELTPDCTGMLKITVNDKKTWQSFFRYIPAIAQPVAKRFGWNVFEWWDKHVPISQRRSGIFRFGGEWKNKYEWTEAFECECPCD